MFNKEFITIIIPAHNEEDVIEQCILSLKQLNYPQEYIEIIIINDGSTDNTNEIIKKYEDHNIKIIQTQGVGPSKCRNLCIKQATGKYIAFTDADCVVDKQWLIELLKGLSYNIVGVGGNQLLPEHAHKFEKKVHDFLQSMHMVSDYVKTGRDMRNVKDFASCNCLYLKSILEEIGGFDEKLWPGEDVELNYKITRKGYNLRYNPNAIVMHHRPKTIAGFFRMMNRYGWSQAYLIKKYGFFRKIHYVPLFELLILILLIAIMINNIKIGLIIVFSLIMIVLLIFIFRNGIIIGLNNFVLFLTTIIAWNLGFINFYICNKHH